VQTKAELIQHFLVARSQLRALLPEIDVHMEIYPGWKIREVLAHLAGWDDATIIALQKFVEGEPPLMTAARGIDFYNSQTVAERKELSLEQVIREWEWVREQLIPILDRLPTENLDNIIVTPWGVNMSIFTMLKIMVDHEEEHTEVIKARMANPHQAPNEH
jgi:hypothetical protein